MVKAQQVFEVSRLNEAVLAAPQLAEQQVEGPGQRVAQAVAQLELLEEVLEQPGAAGQALEPRVHEARVAQVEEAAAAVDRHRV